MHHVLRCAGLSLLLAGVLPSGTGQERAATPAVLGEREQMLAVFRAMPAQRLRAYYLQCDAGSRERLLDLADAIACAMASDALLQREFGGRFEALLEWWRAHRQAVATD